MMVTKLRRLLFVAMLLLVVIVFYSSDKAVLAQSNINVGDIWKYFKGTSNPGSGWNDVGFNDSGWLQGPTGIGYGDGDDATVLSDMRNNYKTVYARKTFNISNASAVTGMTFNMDYDDGFVAYINGVEVARRKMSSGTS